MPPCRPGKPARGQGPVSRTSALDRLVRHWSAPRLRLRCGTPQPGSGQAREERGFPPLPGEPPTRDSDRFGLLDRQSSSRARGGPDSRRRPLSGGCGASRPASFFGTATVSWCPMATGILRDPRVSSPSISARRSAGRRAGNAAGAERSSSCINAFLRILADAGRIGRARECGPVERKDLEGEQSPWKDRARPDRQRSGAASELDGGATPRSRRSERAEPGGPSPATVAGGGAESLGANGKGATATVTWCGCRRGFLRGV